MILKIKSYLMAAMMTLSFGAPALVVASVGTASAAGCSHIAQQIAKGSEGATSGNASAGCTATGVNDDGITSAAKKLVDLISLVVGIVAVLFVIFGGFRYITSGGDSGKVGNAKNSLIYAVVGLIIVALAQLIVRFVLNQSGTLTNP